jgi:uncharacterized protein YceK
MAVRALYAGLLLSGLLVAGCGTVSNAVLKRPEDGGKTPFGGVREDVAHIKSAAGGGDGKGHSEPELESQPQVGRILIFAADLPFSIVADVILWPYTWAFTRVNEPVPVPPVVQAPAELRPQISP